MPGGILAAVCSAAALAVGAGQLSAISVRRQEARIVRLRSALVFAVVVLHSYAAPGSQTASKSLARISNESAIVVVGVVEQLDRVSSTSTDGDRFVAYVRIVSYLRGQSTATAFELRLHTGGLRGFDTKLAAGLT